MNTLASKNPNIGNWSKAISNHVWYAAEKCQESETELIRIWSSMFKHVQNIHEWTDDSGVLQKCGHDDLGDEESRWKNWLKDGELRELKKVKVYCDIKFN